MICQFTPLLIFLAALIFLAGSFVFVDPARAIELQKRFYAKINWRIEPIDMRKELRNTKIMGLSMVIAAILSAILYLVP